MQHTIFDISQKNQNLNVRSEACAVDCGGSCLLSGLFIPEKTSRTRRGRESYSHSFESSTFLVGRH